MARCNFSNMTNTRLRISVIPDLFLLWVGWAADSVSVILCKKDICKMTKVLLLLLSEEYRSFEFWDKDIL